MSLILIAGGGTAGHVVPALAVADVLAERGYEVHFSGGPAGMESELVPRAGYPFWPVRIRGFERRLGLTTLRTLYSLPLAALDAWRLLSRLEPRCVVGVGAYASGPVVAEAAVLRRLPAVAIEMDSHLGWTNRILSLVVDRVFLSFPGAHAEGGKFVFAGRPIRPVLFQTTRGEGLARFGLTGERPVVLAFGGSLGSRSINRTVAEAFAAEETPFDLLHVTGRRDYEWVRGRVTAAQGNPRYQVHSYLDDFHHAIAAADVAIARAGGSVAELLAWGVPALLVPFPGATADHQTKNAQALQEAGAAFMLPDAELTADRLRREVQRLLEEPVRERMSSAARALARPNAAATIADYIVELAGPPRGRP